MNKKEVFKTLSDNFKSTLEKPLNTNIITGKVLLGRPEEPLNVLEVFIHGTLENVIIGVGNDGKNYIGVRNKTGNGYRTIPLEALAALLWDGEHATNNKTVLNDFKSGQELRLQITSGDN